MQVLAVHQAMSVDKNISTSGSVSACSGLQCVVCTAPSPRAVFLTPYLECLACSRGGCCRRCGACKGCRHHVNTSDGVQSTFHHSVIIIGAMLNAVISKWRDASCYHCVVKPKMRCGASSEHLTMHTCVQRVSYCGRGTACGRRRPRGVPRLRSSSQTALTWCWGCRAPWILSRCDPRPHAKL